MYKCALMLEELKLKVNLGLTAFERNKKQTVVLYIKIAFKKPPLACKTAKISDTICYDQLIKKIQKFCQNKKFILIEEMGMKILQLLKKNTQKNCKIYLRIAKQYPLNELTRSVFEIID
jgi:FolB domain-containing protein